MPLRKPKPTTPSLRGTIFQSFEDITERKPKKSLLLPLKKKAGRDSSGRVSVRHRGKGHKRRLRKIDYRRDKPGVPGIVHTIEYDPNRSARIGLVKYNDGDWRYIIMPQGLGVGDVVSSGVTAEIKPGNALPIGSIPNGTSVRIIFTYSHFWKDVGWA